MLGTIVINRLALSGIIAFSAASFADELRQVDFNRDIRPILSQNCLLCHGPDEHERKGKLRLDLREDALKSGSSGNPAIMPGAPEKSELMARVTHQDPDELMPPAKSDKKLGGAQIELLRLWIQQGARYATHWAYAPPVRPALPEVRNSSWPRGGLDYFILGRLEHEDLAPSPEADRYSLARRMALDLTGLPPTIAEVDQFANDPGGDAYEKMVDRILAKESFGEHWARLWLDLARYADSAGYADDPLRTIWRYRDYVIKAFNDNKPFDEFTLEQIGGDLLPEPDEEDLVATAFHRNTMTNNEGGTADEEFRNAAIVDRVNTTMAVWMGTSIACAQCHTHKYDPITQDEYFQFMAFLDNTEDADRPDESPTHKFFTRSQERQRESLKLNLSVLEQRLTNITPELAGSFERWNAAFPKNAEWQTLTPAKVEYQRQGAGATNEDGTISVGAGAGRDLITLEVPLKDLHFTALRLEPLPPGRVVSPPKIVATLIPPNSRSLTGRFVRIEIPGKDRILSLAEVQIFSGTKNIALGGTATQSSTENNAEASLAIDGKTEGDFQAKTTTHTKSSENPWWEVDLKDARQVSRIAVWNRTDNKLQVRLKDFRIALLNEKKEVVWDRSIKDPPNPNTDLTVDGMRVVQFAGNFSDGLTSIAGQAETYPEGTVLKLEIEQKFDRDELSLNSFKLLSSADPAFWKFGKNPPDMLTLLNHPDRSPKNSEKLREYYQRNVAPELDAERKRFAELNKEFDGIKPNSVPIMRELAGEKRRKTRFQFRGNYMDVGKEVSEGVPVALSPLPEGAPRNRLGLAQWLIDARNPLTARVVANRFWEQIFGIGLVRTSEEFGSQGELPSHPELLDWLAVELVETRWDVKRFLKMLVTSAAYRQSSRVTPEMQERDPDNRLLARGPRFRIGAEMVRDQALSVAGLLSAKMYGPSVKPAQPSSGLSAAFGSSVDWKTSEGEDRFRRGLYTEWRRTSPYPSMSTFDAPNREVCTLRRSRTSTPLQALVTLNDPVFLEAAQGLARRMAQGGDSIDEKLRHGFRLCLARPPRENELERLKVFYAEAVSVYKNDGAKAKQLATTKSSDARADGDEVELAALTTVANVLLNLDETLMKR